MQEEEEVEMEEVEMEEEDVQVKEHVSSRTLDGP